MKLNHLLSLVILLAFSCFSLADGSAEIAIGNNETMSLNWLNNGSVHMSTNLEKNSYMLILDNKAYAVHKENGEYQVLDLSSLMESLGAMAGDMSPMSIESELDIDWDSSRLNKTGKKRTVAGIQGDVYTIKGDDSGDFVVLSNHTLAQEMTAAYFRIIKIMAAEHEGVAIDKALPKNQQGLLQAGEDFKVLKLSNKTPNKALFKLPAEPQNLGDMMQEMQKMMMQQMGQ